MYLIRDLTLGFMPDVSAQDSVLTFDCMLLLRLHSYILDFIFIFIICLIGNSSIIEYTFARTLGT